MNTREKYILSVHATRTLYEYIRLSRINFFLSSNYYLKSVKEMTTTNYHKVENALFLRFTTVYEYNTPSNHDY